MPEDSSSSRPADTRRLAAIMFTDIVGFSRQMGADEAHMLRILAVHNQMIQQAVAEHHGYVIKTMGDGFLVDFPSVVNAVQCAKHVQAQFRAYNAEKESAQQIHVRIGIHLGDIIRQNGDVLGDGVNVASRLQSLAEPDTICISHAVYKEIEKKLPLDTVIALGKPKLKNIAQREPAYALLPEPPRGFRQRLHVHRLKLKQRQRTLQIAALVLGVVLVSVSTLIIRNRYLPAPTPEQPKEGTLPTSQTTLPLPDKPSIVVLPFDNMSGDPQQDYFSNGITEVLTSDLSRISSLFVIARNTAFSIGKSRNVQEVGKELSVRYVVEGSVQKTAEQVRIVAQLIDTTTGGHLWSQRYDRPLKDIFALQDDIVQKIVTTLNLQLTLREQGVQVRKGTDDPEAYDSFLRGLNSLLSATREANTQARQMFEKAIALDPQYAQAYASLGATYWLEFAQQWNLDLQIVERAFELVQKAVALDDSLPQAHSTLALIYLGKRQPDRALAEAERAVTLDPSYADAYTNLAQVLNTMGRPQEALKAVETALRLNPYGPFFYFANLAFAYHLIGQDAEAITAMKEAIKRNPNFVTAYVLLADGYVKLWLWQLSDDPQILGRALEAAQQAVALNASAPFTHFSLGMVHLTRQHYDQAIVEMERIITLDPSNATGYAGLAWLLPLVGKKEEALGYAEQAERLGPPALPTGYDIALGFAYYFLGHYEQAIPYLKKMLVFYPSHCLAHTTLAAIYSELGRDMDARAEVAEVLRINPNFSLEVNRQREPIKDPAILERHIAALRKAGLK